MVGWRKLDAPTVKKLPIEVDVLEAMVNCGRTMGETALVQAIRDLARVAFYFLLREGEYTVKFSGLNTKQTDQFWAKDVHLFKRCELGTFRQLPPSAPSDDMLNGNSATLRLGNRKNGWKNMCIHQEANGCTYFCATRAIARRLIYIHENTSEALASIRPTPTLCEAAEQMRSISQDIPTGRL
jgi:hypothetical protein